MLTMWVLIFAISFRGKTVITPKTQRFVRANAKYTLDIPNNFNCVCVCVSGCPFRLEGLGIMFAQPQEISEYFGGIFSGM